VNRVYLAGPTTMAVLCDMPRLSTICIYFMGIMCVAFVFFHLYALSDYFDSHLLRPFLARNSAVGGR